MKLTSIVLASVVAEKLEIEQCGGARSVDNGEITCKKKACRLKKCDDGFTMVTPKGSSRKNLCIDHKNGPKWDKNMPKCITCSDDALEEVTSKGFNTECKSKRHKKDCTVTCSDKKNRIYPFRKKEAKTKCICDKETETCSWQQKNPEYYHGGSLFGTDAPYVSNQEGTFAFSNWSCSQKPVPEPVVPIQQGLTCSRVAGEQSRKRRVVGGAEAEQHSWPWIVQITADTDLPPEQWIWHTHCSGTIINSKIVVTLASCYEVIFEYHKVGNVYGLHLVAGDHYDATIDFNNNDYDYELEREKSPNRQTNYVKAEDVHLHPDLNRNPRDPGIDSVWDYDAAVLIVEKPWVLDEYVSPVCLPTPEQVPTQDTPCWTAGWGGLKSSMDYPQAQPIMLHEVDLQVMSEEACAQTQTNFLGGGLNPSVHLCAGTLSVNGNFDLGGKGPCYYDEGSPLICAIDGEPVFVGIAGEYVGQTYCASERQVNMPAYFTKVSQVNEFILSFVDQ